MSDKIDYGDLMFKFGCNLADIFDPAIMAPRMMCNCDGTGLIDQLHYLAHRDDAGKNHGYRTRCVVLGIFDMDTDRYKIKFIIEKLIACTPNWFRIEHGHLEFIEEYGWNLVWYENL